MALDFPNPPLTVGQQYAAPTGVGYVWDGAVWTVAGLPAAGAAGGDLSGTYPNPQITAGTIVDADVSATAAIQYTKLTGVPTALPPNGAASGDLTGTYPAPTIGALKVTDAKVNDVAATKLTGTIAQARFPVAPSGLLTANVNDAQITAVKLAAGVIPTTLPPSGTAGGSLAGSYPNPTLTTSGVTAGTYGTTAKIPQVTLTAEGRVSAVTELAVAPTGGSPTGSAGGSLAGSYPNPTVAASAIRGTPSSGGTAREIAKVSIWGGDDLIDLSVPDAKIAALAYSKLTGAPTALPPSGAAGGDLQGTYPNPTLTAAAKSKWTAGATLTPTGTFANLLTLDASGNLTATGNATFGGAGSPLVNLGIRGAFETWDGGILSLYLNAPGYLNHVATSASCKLVMDNRAGGVPWSVSYRPASGGFAGIISSDTAGNFTISGATANKASGTTWANPSDPRLKREVAAYAAGLDAIAQLVPIMFKYNGLGGTTDDDRVCYGLDASAVQPVMPECVGTRTAKLHPDDARETEMLTLDASCIIWALVNAVKELAARVAALEATAPPAGG